MSSAPVTLTGHLSLQGETQLDCFQRRGFGHISRNIVFSVESWPPGRVSVSQNEAYHKKEEARHEDSILCTIRAKMSHSSHNTPFLQNSGNMPNDQSASAGNKRLVLPRILPLEARAQQSQQQTTVQRDNGPALRQNLNAINESNGTTTTSKDALIQKLESAMSELRRKRDQEYRQKVEAEERLRLVQQEKEELEKIVTNLKSKFQSIRTEQSKTQASLVPLEETEVPELRRKVGSRTAIWDGRLLFVDG